MVPEIPLKIGNCQNNQTGSLAGHMQTVMNFDLNMCYVHHVVF